MTWQWANLQWRGVRRLSVCPSVRLSVNFCANRFFSQANGRIATKLSQDWLQFSVHPGCAQGQGQGQRSRDTRTFLDSWNELLRHWRSGIRPPVTTYGRPNNNLTFYQKPGLEIKPCLEFEFIGDLTNGISQPARLGVQTLTAKSERTIDTAYEPWQLGKSAEFWCCIRPADSRHLACTDCGSRTRGRCVEVVQRSKRAQQTFCHSRVVVFQQPISPPNSQKWLDCGIRSTTKLDA